MGCTASRTSDAGQNDDTGEQSRTTASASNQGAVGPTVTPQADNMSTIIKDVTLTSPGQASVASTTTVPGLQQQNQDISVMHKVKHVLQELNAIPNDGSRSALAQAATVLQKHLIIADAVSLIPCISQTPIGVIGGAAGTGGQEMLKQSAYFNKSHSAAVCSRKAPSTPYMYDTVKDDESVDNLPPDWAVLYRDYGLCTFLAVALISNDVVVGVMMLASKQVSAFQQTWLDPLLNMICTALSPFMCHPLMTGLCSLAIAAHQESTRDYRAYIRQLIEASTMVLESATNLKFSVRFGLFSDEVDQLLVMHVLDNQQPSAGSSAAGLCHPSLSVSNAPAANTVMWEAHSTKGPRLVPNIQEYMESVAQPGLDVFLEGQPPISSLLVIPFIYQAEASAQVCQCGMYVASYEPGDFSESRRAIVSTATLLQWLLAPCLKEDGMLACAVADIHTSKGAVSRRSSSDCMAEGSQGSFTAVHARSAGGFMQLMQQQMQSRADRKQTARYKADHYEDLTLQRVLGVGGFGTVYQGLWKGSTAAVKVMVVPKQQRRLMKAALEMAVQQSLSHPNIVRVYAVLTDMCQESVGADGVSLPAYSSSDFLNVRFRHAGLYNSADGNIACNIMIMELCDVGSLDTAIRNGVLHASTSAGSTVVNMWWLLQVLLDIARSLQHIHSRSLIHCDLKPANVLLKSNRTRPVGFDCKLGDFGLVKWMSHGQSHLHNNSINGTVTHLAPERYQTGSRLTSAVDIYAFGIIMYEAYTARRPFSGLKAGAMAQAVLRGERPVFGPGVPSEYQKLAEACWAQTAEERPSADEVVTKLQALLNQCELLRSQQSAAQA